MQIMGQSIAASTLALRTDVEGVVCVNCKQEFGKLYDSGLCYDCQEERYRTADRQQSMQRKLRECMGDRGYEDYTFLNFRENSENARALNFCRQFDPEKDNLYLVGNVGSGKTHLAYATARMWIGKKRIEIYKQPDLLRMFRKKSEDEERRLLKNFADADILVIDDMGVSKNTEFSSQILYEIIDRRYMAKKNGLIITSNLHIDDLSKQTDEMRMADRLVGMCLVVRLNAEVSWRVKQRNGRLKPEN